MLNSSSILALLALALVPASLTPSLATHHVSYPVWQTTELPENNTAQSNMPSNFISEDFYAPSIHTLSYSTFWDTSIYPTIQFIQPYNSSNHTIQTTIQFIQPYNSYNHTIHTTIQFIQPYNSYNHTIHPTIQFIQPYNSYNHTIHPTIQFIQPYNSSNHTIHTTIQFIQPIQFIQL